MFCTKCGKEINHKTTICEDCAVKMQPRDSEPWYQRVAQVVDDALIDGGPDANETTHDAPSDIFTDQMPDNSENSNPVLQDLSNGLSKLHNILIMVYKISLVASFFAIALYYKAPPLFFGIAAAIIIANIAQSIYRLVKK